MYVTVKELKEWLNICNDNAHIIIDYTCNDDYYNYYGTVEEIDFDNNDLVLRVIN